MNLRQSIDRPGVIFPGHFLSPKALKLFRGGCITLWPMNDGQETKQLNSLAGAASAYLRSAMHQPVEWKEWGEEAFALAQTEDKPILLDIGAVWCHWCHVMDRESYEDAETARVINLWAEPGIPDLSL